jgi:phage protein D
MALVTLLEESKAHEGFYVPRFEIRLSGANLPLVALRDVLQVTYSDDIKKLDSFEITVNNWDADAREFKYVGAETLRSMDETNKDPKKPFNPLHRIFEPCRHKVEVFMGYGSNLKLMLTGNFTTLEPTFPSSGGPTLTVRGLNQLHKLRTSQRSDSWPNKRESEIALSFEKLPDPDRPGKKLPVLINKTALGKEEQIPYVAQNNQYDIEFLLERARRAGYVVFIKEAEKEGDRLINPRGLYFGPSNVNEPDLDRRTFELQWGLSLIDFKPTLTTANQIASVTVNGWNRASKSRITGKAKIDPEKVMLNRDLHKQLEKCDAREEHVVDEPMFTQRQADKRAEAILLERAKDLVKASGTCIGLPELRAGQRVRIGNLGQRFNGEYFVTDTTHTVNDSGYITKFNVRREEPVTGGNQ